MIDEILTKHNKWVNIIKQLGERNYHEDLVQEAYIRLIKLNKPVNDSYMYMLLRCVYLDYLRAKKRSPEKVSIELIYELEESPEYTEKNYLPLLDEVNKEVDKFSPYEKLLFETHFTKKISLCEIARGTGIGVKSIWLTVQKCKKKIKENHHENYKKIKYDI